jgi:predicted nucleotidyltransferase
MNLSGNDITIIKSFFADKPVLRACFFGSYSRQEAVTDSDIDILVDLDYSQHIGLGFVQMKLDLEEQLHKAVDLVSSQTISQRILPFVNKDKQLIYER